MSKTAELIDKEFYTESGEPLPNEAAEDAKRKSKRKKLFIGFAAGPAISLPIFSGGRIQGAYRGARADFDSAVAAYNQTLIQAVREIADVAARQRALTVRLNQTRAALASSQRAYDLIQARYRGGLTPYFEVLSAEDALNANRRAVADLEASAFALDVALVRALGGGFRHSRPEGTQS